MHIDPTIVGPETFFARLFLIASLWGPLPQMPQPQRRHSHL